MLFYIGAPVVQKKEKKINKSVAVSSTGLMQ